MCATRSSGHAPGDSALTLLARSVSDLKLARIPPEIRRQGRLCILDTVGCIIAGTRTEEADLILACEPPDAGACARVHIAGAAQPRTLMAAIRVNGYLGDVLELNDLIGGHASIGTVSASLALAEAVGAGGEALLEAVIRGIEVTSRVYAAVYPSLKRFTEMGLVPVGIPSSIGVAAAAARLLELDPVATQHAMAIAGATAGWCPAEAIFGNGGTLKPMLFGAQPGATGVSAALYAREGMTGPPELLESKLGYLATCSTAGQVDTGPWAERWALAKPRRKLHACCGYLHSPIDATGELRRRIAGTVLDSCVIEVHVPAYTADAVSKTCAPVSPNDARFHLQYCLALALGDADVILPEHSIEYRAHLAQGAVRQTMSRIRVVPDASLTHYEQSRVVARSGDGKICGSHEIGAPRGSPDNPLSDRDVIDKFLRLARPVIGGRRAECLERSISALESAGPPSEWLHEGMRATE